MPVLDGVRGLAVLFVILFHSSKIRATAPIDDLYFLYTRSTWIGVDLFFVLSGFLITGILYDTKSQSSYFRSFYWRRTVRIFPLYYLVVAFCIFVGPQLPFFGDPGAPDPRPNQWWYWLYLSNYLVALEGFSHSMLGPTWSLAIEEQFYLLWPLLVFFCSRRAIMAISMCLMLFAPLLRALLLFNDFNVNVMYTSTPCRIDTLAAGAFIALAARGPGGLVGLRPWSRIAAATTALPLTYLLCMGYINKKQPIMILYGYSVSALFFASLILVLLTLQHTNLLYRVFTARVLVFFGKYSYALYLFNRPLVDIIRKYFFAPSDFPRAWNSSIPGQVVFTILVLVTSLIFALLSWHLFEKHFLKLKKFFPKRS